MSTEAPRFTHLHAHSSYSIGVGLATPEELCAHAKRAGYSSLALTDINGTYGYLEFHLAARKHGIKPIYGSVVYHTSLISPGRDRFTLVLLAMNHKGLANVAALTSLSAAAYESGIALSLEQLRERAEGVIVLVGNVHSEVGAAMLDDNEAGAGRALDTLKDILRDRVYVEIQDHGEKEEKQFAQRLLKLADDSTVAPVMTQEVRYTGSEMSGVYGLLAGIRHPHEESDFFKIDDHRPERGMPSESDMHRFFSVYPQAYRNAHYIAEKVPLDLFAHIDHPSTLLEKLDDSESVFLDHCADKFQKRFHKITEPDLARYQAILKKEVGEISRSGLISTFLLYERIVGRLRRAGITLGPATGVGLQSLCAYVLEITTYDPYAYEEHFQPMFDSRAESMFELEVQLTSGQREKAVELLRDVIGDRSFAYVPAIERITPARAVRMVSNIVETPEDDVKEILRVISRHPGESLKEMTSEDRQLGHVYNRSIPARELLTRAALIEGLPSGFIKSRRSVAFSSVPLTDYLAESIDGETGDLFIHVGREMLPVEPFHRIDFSPLVAIEVIERAERELEREGVLYTWEEFPRSDKIVWEEIQSGDTTGIFLFDGQIIQQQRQSFPLRTMHELTNLLSLLRHRGDEGTLAKRIESFKRGEIISGSDPPEVLRVLRATRGNIMYDEQLRDLVQVLTDTDPIEALRTLHDARTTEPATLSQMRSRFMRAMAERDQPMEVATSWFDRILFYAKQTIRRERVLADAILVYKMFYLKVHHAGVFHAALLNSHLEHETRLNRYVQVLDDAGRILPLDVNHSVHGFEREGEQVRVGFCIVPGLDSIAVNRIIKTRGKSGFRSMDDFAKKTRKDVDKDMMRRLVEAGAFDAIADRATLLQEAEEPAAKPRSAPRPRKKTSGKGQMDLPFDPES